MTANASKGEHRQQSRLGKGTGSQKHDLSQAIELRWPRSIDRDQQQRRGNAADHEKYVGQKMLALTSQERNINSPGPSRDGADRHQVGNNNHFHQSTLRGHGRPTGVTHRRRCIESSPPQSRPWRAAAIGRKQRSTSRPHSCFLGVFNGARGSALTASDAAVKISSADQLRVIQMVSAATPVCHAAMPSPRRCSSRYDRAIQ